MKSTIIKKLFSLTFILYLCFTVYGCQDDGILSPTAEFYVNDQAGALLNSTKWTIVAYSDELYNDSSVKEFKDSKIDGTQVVVLTLFTDTDADITEIFNKWGIGKNDMGLLIVVYFDKNGQNEPIYRYMDYEIGIKMSEYLTAFDASNIVDYYFQPEIPVTDIDERLMSLYFGFFEFIYLNVYEYTSYNYESYMDEYIENKYEYFGQLPSEQTDFFSIIPIWGWVIIVILLLLGSRSLLLPFFIFGTGRGFSISGGGGRSRGYRFRK